MGNTKIRNSVKKLFAISFSMILSASALPVLNCSASVTENGAEYGVSVSGEKTYLTLCNVDDTITDLVVPEYIDDKKVEEISLSGNDTLESITLPSSVNKIRFSRCTGLTDINVDTDNECYASSEGILFDKSLKTLICYPQGKTQNVLDIPEGVEAIGESAFEYYSGIEEVNFPDSLKEIRQYAFFGCNIKNLVFPSGLTTIKEEAFADNYTLENVVFSENTVHTSDLFNSCSNLKTVTFLTEEISDDPVSSDPDAAKVYYTGVLDNSMADVTVYVPDNKIDVYKNNAGLWRNVNYEILPLSQRPADLTGDTNLDRKINVSDAVFLGSYLTNKRESITQNADINGDGEVNVFDMIAIRRNIANFTDL